MVETFVRKIMKIVEKQQKILEIGYQNVKGSMALFFTGKIMEIMKIAENVYENYGKCREL